ncbi:hypothetical protein MUY27_03050 [Mucilaginibacter sp. RS28]|uniref:Uncharacterized protein n=1 Tax=Mucilaginibacter straminoryzae TaxID=2932774 RepID=A0A9X1X4U5_9SPHI|nr:hypothetical protein [Mucilaginibacter straminoryzae]MCJ8208669.1 hypothetical protein [Mucilaginibacter straminoryzae]
MNNLQLYINDQLADLTDDSPIALTFQINNLGEVKNQQGNTSNQFKLPLTQNNRRILGFPDSIAFCTKAPYSKYPARIIQDGLEIVPYGQAELNSVEQDVANITVLSGNVDFFDAIDGKIYDLGDSTTSTGLSKPFKSYDHAWTLDNVVASQRKTEGWIWPVVDYGAVERNIDKPINVRYLRPGFFLKTAIDIMVNNAGFKATGSLLNDPLYQKLIVQFANDSFQHGTDIQNGPNQYSVSAQTTADLHCDPSGNRDGLIPFQQVNNGSPLIFDNTNYTAPQDMEVTVDLLYGVKVRGTKGGDISVYIGIRYDGRGDLNVARHDGHKSSDYQFYEKQKISVDLQMKQGDKFRIWYWLESKQTDAYFLSGSLLTITNKQNDVLYKQTVQCERIFPDISQKDLLKDTLQRFGVICQTNNTTRTVNFAFFKDIVANIPVAKDWSDKCLDQGKSVAFQLGGYAQTNYMKYKADDNVLPPGFADSQIRVDDATLPATADLFESQFAPSLVRPWGNSNISIINKIDQNDPANTDFSVSTEPRILINDTVSVQNVTFTDGSATRVLTNDVVSIPYFDKPNGEYSLKFEQLRLKYYPELERILKYSKKVVRYFLLSPRDILELDLLVPVYLRQDSCYYYINKIDSWRKGQPTKVELIKLG